MFWKEKRLGEMSSEEWESLCDRCGKCCTIKLQDELSGQLYDTTLVCKLFDKNNCQCKSYAQRHKYVKDCIKLSIDNIHELNWLPDTCAYKLVAEGKDLYSWHHLISGNYKTIHETRNTVVTDGTKSETDVEKVDYEDYITREIVDYDK